MAIEQTKPKRNGVILLVILAAVVGIVSGAAGHLISRAYILGNDYGLPFFGDIALTKDRNLIITGAKNVVVEQNAKISETINSTSPALAGIFKKKEAAPGADGFNPDDYYRLDEEMGQGLIITSDGWIMTSLFIEEARPAVVLSDYVIITKDGRIYEIDDFVKDPLTPFSFVHAAGARDFPVRNFLSGDEAGSGELVIISNWEGKNLLTYIIGKKDILAQEAKSSDAFFDELILADNPGADFFMSTVFDLSGNIVGLIDKAGQAYPISHFSSIIDSLLRFRQISRPFLGLNYVDLSFLAGDGLEMKKGAIIYKDAEGVSVLANSPASLAGLEAGDIIISVDGREINQSNNLTYLIQSYLPGDKVNIIYERQGEEREVEIELGEAE